MTFAGIAFWAFAISTVTFGLLVILARNPVHSVLCLITTFISVAGLFVLMGAEYLAFLLIIVYVGAVAVLFLFVVMMLDVDFAELKSGFAEYLPYGVIVGVVLLVNIGLVVAAWQLPTDPQLAQPYLTGAEMTANLEGPNNAEALGMVLYTDYIHYFQIAGMVLLVAMIGAIILTFRERKGIKKQNPGDQAARKREDAVEVVSVQTGKGI
ncbi:NADH-quinone oxidoreductase subunit J [Parvularcula flava]|uniref:NADH-quinone oxidoreductase subunit J n=1 Tax=Aquisalinus luteolus TaxID=1566827 RepID=A0A8J3ETS6_9PROT|nr:NADH-quinone oxidoreductase subunit J [Aquisalinus luteolus]NHK27273.1 NADH-quinone oxidoreductase subunit J [Aquisalinus luteolus]GGH94936.1 NADH:ubiquinone oxidoreductase subunit J [Aquisalinus luteolus]